MPELEYSSRCAGTASVARFAADCSEYAEGLGLPLVHCRHASRSFSIRLPPCTDEAELAGKRLKTLLALNSVFTSFGASDTFSLNSFETHHHCIS